MQPDATQLLAMLGDLALVQERFDRARTYYNQIEAKVHDDLENAFMLTCVESRSGHLSEALKWLELSLRRGYRDYKELNRNEQLSALRSDPRFIPLIRHNFPEET